MPQADPRAPSRPRLVVALTFSVLPARGGGQIRVLKLFGELARFFDVEVISLVGAGDAALVRELAPGVIERTVPKTAVHAVEEARLEREAGTVVTDIAMVRLHDLTPAYGEAIARASKDARAVVACHPYAYEAISGATDAPLWYEAQDVEIDLKAEILSVGDTAKSLLADVERVEGACCREAEVIWTCSALDRDALVARYGIDAQRVLVAPNGVDLANVGFVDAARRARLRDRLRLSSRGQVVFVGSWHEPNIVAGRRMVASARELPSVDFLLVGSVCGALDPRLMPGNVGRMGIVGEGLKAATLSVVDGALNPMSSGSGTNLKMLEYFAAGAPVVSTPFGARGLGAVAGEHYIAADPGSFAEGVRELLAQPCERIAAMTRTARQLVEMRYTWSAIADRLHTQLPGGKPSRLRRA